MGEAVNPNVDAYIGAPKRWPEEITELPVTPVSVLVVHGHGGLFNHRRVAAGQATRIGCGSGWLNR